MDTKHDDTKRSIRKILSIDGGGIKGTCPASFLAALEEDLDEPIGRYFDLITGTSTGGILAIGLALGIPAKQLLQLYVERGPEIFGQPVTRNRFVAAAVNTYAKAKHYIKPKHKVGQLEKVLSDTLGSKLIADAETRLIIPAWDADLNSVYIYKTAHHTRLTTDYKKSAVDAALATTAAPTYFKVHRTVDQVGLIDGGVWANNPTGIAVVEATTLLGWEPKNIRVLSLGCLDEIYSLPDSPGLIGLGSTKAIDLFMDGQSKGAMGIAKLILDHPHSGESIFRYAPKVPTKVFSLDDTSKIQKLQGLGSSMARNAKPQLNEVFFQQTALKFKPIYELDTQNE